MLISVVVILLVFGVLLLTGKLSSDSLKKCCVKKVTIGEMTINLEEFNEVKEILN